MANEQTTLIRVNPALGAIKVGPFRAGPAYSVPAGTLALLGDRFVPATLAKDEQAVAISADHQAVIDAAAAQKKVDDEAKAAAKADASAAVGKVDSTPAAAGNVTGG